MASFSPNHSENGQAAGTVESSTDGTPPERERAKSAAHGVIFLTISNGAMILFGYLVHIMAARLLTEADYGRLVVVIGVMLWIRSLQTSLIILGIYQVVSEDHNRLKAALAVAARWHTAATVVLVVLFLAAAPLIGSAFSDRGLVVLLLIAAIDIPFAGALTLGRWLLNALRRYGLVSAVVTVYGGMRAACVCVLLLAGLGVAGALAGHILAAAVAGTLAMILLLRERKHLPGHPYPAMLRRALSWSAMSVPAGIGTATLMAMDIWLVKAMVADPAKAGVYGAAYVVSRLPHFVVQGLTGAVYPRVSNALAAGKKELARSVSKEAIRLLIILFLPICCLVAASASEITSLLFSARYAGAGAPLVLLIVAGSCFAAFSTGLSLIAAANHPGVRMGIVLGLLPVGAVLNVLLIPRFELQGAATASLVTFGLGAAVAGIFVYRYVGAAPPMWTCLRCSASGAIIYLLSRFWMVTGWLVLGKLVALAALYMLLLVVLRELGKKEFLAIKRAITR